MGLSEEQRHAEEPEALLCCARLLCWFDEQHTCVCHWVKKTPFLNICFCSDSAGALVWPVPAGWGWMRGAHPRSSALGGCRPRAAVGAVSGVRSRNTVAFVLKCEFSTHFTPSAERGWAGGCLDGEPGSSGEGRHRAGRAGERAGDTVGLEQGGLASHLQLMPVNV